MFAAPSFQANAAVRQRLARRARHLPQRRLVPHAAEHLLQRQLSRGNGGTSIVAPELAGFFAQENAYLLARGNICGSGSPPARRSATPTTRSTRRGCGFTPHNPFYDITSGCNSNNVGTGYCAGTGYDLVTGWGSANMLQLAWAFNWHLFADDGRPSVTFSGSDTIGTGTTPTRRSGISVADTGGGAPGERRRRVQRRVERRPRRSHERGDARVPATRSTAAPSSSTPPAARWTSPPRARGATRSTCEAWDNMGLQSGDATDGPLCYDSVAPTITAAPTVQSAEPRRPGRRDSSGDRPVERHRRDERREPLHALPERGRRRRSASVDHTSASTSAAQPHTGHT